MYFAIDVLNLEAVELESQSQALTSFVCLLGLRDQRLLEVSARQARRRVICCAGSGRSAVGCHRGNSGELCVSISSCKLDSEERREWRLAHANLDPITMLYHFGWLT